MRGMSFIYSVFPVKTYRQREFGITPCCTATRKTENFPKLVTFGPGCISHAGIQLDIHPPGTLPQCFQRTFKVVAGHLPLHLFHVVFHRFRDQTIP